VFNNTTADKESYFIQFSLFENPHHVSSGLNFFAMAQQAPPILQWARTSSLSRLHDHTRIHHSALHHCSGRVISPTERPLPDKKQHLQETDNHAPTGIEPTVPVSDWPQTRPVDSAATGIGQYNNKSTTHKLRQFSSTIWRLTVTLVVTPHR
jgi:hypothetical protein